MGHITENARDCGESIYTLAQSGTHTPDIDITQREIMVYGKGSDLNDAELMKRRAKRKFVTNVVVLQLIDIAKAKGDLDRVQSYWNTYHCNTNVTTANGRVYTRYCKNRFCTLCLSIRKAKIINKYLPVIKKWEQPYFVTLTVKSVTADRLAKWMLAMKVAFTRIRQRCNKRHQRGKGIKLMGIKSLECNFNPNAKTYNPHYHLIVPNKEIASELVVEWQRTWNKKQKLTSAFAQDMKPVYDTEKALIEIIKYGSKIFTEPDLKKKQKSGIPMQVYAAALDNIFVAMKGIRLFDRFGFDLPKSFTKHKSKVSFYSNFEEWEYIPQTHDWINPNTGELLTGYIPNPNLQYLLNNAVNIELE